jgi:hypothetical protein
LDCVMNNVFLRHVALYPRFQVTTRSTFEHCSSDVIELQVPLTLLMMNIQVSLMELSNACLQELRSSTHSSVIATDVESNQYSNEATAQRHQDTATVHSSPHTIGLRDILQRRVGGVHQREALRATRKNVHSSQGTTGSWLYLPAADRLWTGEWSQKKRILITSVDLLLKASKCRVFREVPKKKQVQENNETVEDAKLEENPKLKLVPDLLKEIRENDDNKVLGPPITLIVCAEDWACAQLKQVCLYAEIDTDIVRLSLSSIFSMVAEPSLNVS